MELPFSLLACQAYIDFAYISISKNGEDLLCWNHKLYTGRRSYIFPPSNPKNMAPCYIYFVEEDYLEYLTESGTDFKIVGKELSEFYYSTADFINQTRFQKQIRYFLRKNECVVLNHYSKEKLTEFYYSWKEQKKHSAYLDEDEKFFFFCLKNLETYKIRQVYVLIEDKLVGLAWGMQHQNGWIILIFKNLYKYNSLNYYLMSVIAGEFSELEEFSFGTDVYQSSLNNYKKHLLPKKIKTYHCVSIN